MKNKLHYVSSDEMNEQMKKIEKNNSIYIAQVDGNLIQSADDFLVEMSKVFKFPIPTRSFNGYFDWIRDLSWINKDGYILIIRDYNEFMREDLILKKEIINDLEEIVFPWWEGEIEQFVVEGKPKSFNVYLVS